MESKRINIWLIDDNEIDNFINRKTLFKNERVGNVKDFTSATVAQDYIDTLLGEDSVEEALPDFILLDLNMPVFSGIDFMNNCEEKLMQLNPNVKIIILTSSVNPNDEFASSSFGTFMAYLNKPLNVSDLNILFD